MQRRRTHRLVALVFAIGIAAPMLQPAHADIFEWEYVNPNDPSQGKQQSSTLVPDGAGLVAAPNALLYHSDLTKAYLIGANLTDATFFNSQLTNADLSQANLIDASAMQANFTNADLVNANLTNSTFQKAVLTNARLTGAIIDGAIFQETVQFGFTASQLYSTANYQNRDLSGINFNKNDLTGWDFSGQNLMGTQFSQSIVKNANFTGADIRGANLKTAAGLDTGMTLAQLYTTASYQNNDLSQTEFENSNFSYGYFGAMTLVGTDLPHQLTGATFTYTNLSGANLGGTNLTIASLIGANLDNASLSSSTLANTVFTNAIVTRAILSSTVANGFTAAQLYSTASYVSGDLSGIKLNKNNLTGWNFSGKNLSGASFAQSTLQGTNFASANLVGADFTSAILAGAIFDQADIRGVIFNQSYLGGDELSTAQLYSTASYQSGDLTGVRLFSHDLSGWNFSGKNLSSGSFGGSYLNNADLSNANLTGVDLGFNVTGANFTDAVLTGAYISASGFTPGQLYSTASYKNHDLRGIHFTNANVNLSGWDLSNQDLTGVEFRSISLAGTNFSNAIINDARFESINPGTFTPAQLYSTASYQNHDLRGLRLSASGNAFDLTLQDLTGADLTIAWSGTNLTDAVVGGTHFHMYSSGSVLTATQIYSTASYQLRNMAGVKIEGWQVTLDNWDMSGINLSNAVFSGHFEAGYLTLNEFNFAGADLTNASFDSVIFTNTNFSGADARGASIYLNFASVTTTNLIHPDGTIQGLNLTSGNSLVVRDYDNPIGPAEIEVENGFSADNTSVLKMVFDADDWNSKFTFENGIAVTLDGALQLSFADGVNLATQVGRSFQLFDWSNVSPSGEFTIDSPYVWDATDLYSLGQVRLISIVPNLPADPPGDFNQDGVIDTADYILLRKVGGLDPSLYETWRHHFGQTPGGGARGASGAPTSTPEPSVVVLIGMVIACFAARERRVRRTACACP